jgi:hypothetical protein
MTKNDFIIAVRNLDDDMDRLALSSSPEISMFWENVYNHVSGIVVPPFLETFAFKTGESADTVWDYIMSAAKILPPLDQSNPDSVLVYQIIDAYKSVIEGYRTLTES